MNTTLDVDVPAIKERVTKILTEPAPTWQVIAGEATTAEKLYRSYLAPLAAIPAIAGFIGWTIIGVSVPFVGTVRNGFAGGLAQMIVSYVLSLVAIYVAAIIIDRLAPTFESTANQLQALKLVGYAMTPSFLAGIFYAVPALSILAALGGLYAIYLFYVGLPVMMRTPEPKVVPYMLVSAVVVLVAMFVIGLLSAAITGPRF